MFIICLKNKLIISDCSWAQMALTPIIVDKTAKIIARKIKYTNALESTLNSLIFLKTLKSLILPEDKDCIRCLLYRIVACITLHGNDFASHLIDFPVFNFKCLGMKFYVTYWRPFQIIFCKNRIILLLDLKSHYQCKFWGSWITKYLWNYLLIVW